MPGSNGRTHQPPLFSPGMSPSPASHPTNICGIPLVEGHRVKSITADSKIFINDNKNVCLPAGVRDREKGNKGPQGGIGEARSPATREAAGWHLRPRRGSVTPGVAHSSELQHFHRHKVDPPVCSQQACPLCARSVSRPFT